MNKNRRRPFALIETITDAYADIFHFSFMRLMAAPVNVVVQYILLRRDLKKMKNYNDGAIIAQACHASSAILYRTLDDDLTKSYFSNLDRMHKIILGVDGGESELNELSCILKQNSIEHYLWTEQPENIPTAIAVKPYYKKDVEHLFSKYKLYR